MFTSFITSNFSNSIKIFFQDLFRDSNSKKYSLSRFLAVALFVMVIWFHKAAIEIMIEKKEIDHTLLFEDFTFIGSIVVSKNFLNRKNIEKKIDDSQPSI
jgi:hypothetical protein